MPPRKKATAPGATPAPTRASARIKSSSTTQPASPQPATAPKSKFKRGHTDSETEDDALASKPISKKAKKQDTDSQDDQAVNTTTNSQPPADEPKKMVTDTSICLLRLKF